MKRASTHIRPLDQISTPHLKSALWTRLEEKMQAPWWKTWRVALVPAGSLLLFLVFAFYAPRPAASFQLLVHEFNERPSFTLETQDAEPVENVSVSPAIAFDVVSSSAGTVEVQLTETPDPNVVYTFQARSSTSSFVWTYEVPFVEEEVDSEVEVDSEEEVDGEEESEEPVEQTVHTEVVETSVEPSVETVEPVTVDEEVIVEEEQATPEEPEQTVVVEEVAVTSAPEEQVLVSNETGVEESTVESSGSASEDVTTVDTPVSSSDMPMEEGAPESIAQEDSTPVTDVCVVNLQSFSDVVFVSSYLGVEKNYGVFLVQDGGVLNAANTFGQQLLVLSGGEASNPGIGGIYYLNAGATVHAYGVFTAYVQAGATLWGTGAGGTIYYEAGAEVNGFDEGTTMIECSKILFTRP